MSCTFDSERGQSYRLTLIDEVTRKNRGRPVTLSLAVDGQPEVPAETRLISARQSPVGQPFLRVVARIDSVTAVAFQVAENGDGIFFPYHWEKQEFLVEDGYAGRCSGAAQIIESWR